MSEQVDISSNSRYIEIFKKLVEIYIETGEPVGSKYLSGVLNTSLSPATIRKVMGDLESMGILSSDHVSAGRKPTEKGWRFFVNGLVESSDLLSYEKEIISQIIKDSSARSVESIFENASNTLSNLSHCVSLIMTPTINSEIKHLEFVRLDQGRIIVITVNENGIVENRLISMTEDISYETLNLATNYINSKLSRYSLLEIQQIIQTEVELERYGIDKTTKTLISQGIELFADSKGYDNVIIKGKSNLLSNSQEFLNIEKLIQKLEEKQSIKSLLDQSINGLGVQIFIGSETKMFEFSGCSMVVSAYQNNKKNMVGAIGVLGPARMKYSRVIKLVDLTAKILSEWI